MSPHWSNVEQSIDACLASVGSPEAPTRVSVERLRAWALEYLSDRDSEVSRFPQEAGQPHWNLWMLDGPGDEAVFVVLHFKTDGLALFSGHGSGREIRQFAESEFPDEPAMLHTAMAARFDTPGAVTLGREDGETWLGRGW